MTLQQIANKVGVSKRTVSRILNGQTDRHNAETAQRVLQAAQALNYSPNPLGRALAGGASQSIGLLLRGLGGHLSVQRIATLAAQAQQAGYLTCITTNSQRGDDTDHLIEAARQLLARRVDGLLLHRSLPVSPKARRVLADLPVPVVYLDWGPPRGANRVWFNYNAVAQQIAAHLKDLGHQHVAMLPSRYSADFVEHRIRPCQRALAAESIDLILDEQCFIESGSQYEYTAYEAVRRFLARNQHATAMIMHNDAATVGAMAALRDAGLRVPDDVSVVSFDDLPVAQVLRPTLTTVRTPGAQAGLMAFRMLQELIENPGLPARTQQVPMELIVRQSTGPAPRRAPRVAYDSSVWAAAPSLVEDDTSYQEASLTGLPTNG